MPLTKATLQQLRSLRQKKYREETGLFVVEGPKVVGELLAAGHNFSAIYATDAWQSPVSCPIERVTVAEMERLSHYPTPSSVLAVGKIHRESLADEELVDGFTLALDGIQDPGNVGTMLRIADWFGFDRVLLSPDCADLFSQKVINASMGSFARMRVITTELGTALIAVQTRVPILGCDLEGTPLAQLARPTHAIVVIGSEGQGLSPAVGATLTERITIPKLGGAESLNAGVAAGIVCAHLRA